MEALISACLLGAACRYDAKSKPMSEEKIAALREKYDLIPVCPEQLGGLPTPRPAAERCGEKVLTAEGGDVTEQYLRGAREALYLAKLFGCETAILKAKSPSCGRGFIYDGTHTKTLIEGNGVTAKLLIENGIRVLTEDEV